MGFQAGPEGQGSVSSSLSRAYRPRRQVPQRTFTSIFQTKAYGSSGNISTVTKAGPDGFSVIVQGFLPGTAQTQSPSSKLAAHDVGLCSHLRYWGEGRGARAESGTKQAFKQCPGSQALHISVQARNPGVMTTSDKGNDRASERALQPGLTSGPRGSCNGGRDPVLGSPLQRNTRREGRSSALGSAKPGLYMTWDMALPHSFLGHPHPSPLHEDGRKELADRCPPRSVWSSQEPRTPDPPFKGTTGTSFSLALHQHSRAWRYKTTETKGSQA